jgi:hypothetical protein
MGDAWRQALLSINNGQILNFNLDKTNYHQQACKNSSTNPSKCTAATEYLIALDEDRSTMLQNSTDNTTKNEIPLLKIRQETQEWKNIYPIVNHDFNYDQYAKSIYNPFSLGITNDTETDSMFDGGTRLLNYVGAIVNNPMPMDGTIAGISDIDPEDTQLRQIKNQYKQMPLPYPSFRKDYPESKFQTTGIGSSSYFLKVDDTCPSKITSEEDCIKQGFKWIKTPPSMTPDISGFYQPTKTTIPPKSNVVEEKSEGTCWKPRFLYLDNSAKGIGIMRGLIPSIMNDVSQLAPENIMSVLAGYTGSQGGILPCPEGFIDYKRETKMDRFSMWVMILGAIVLLWFISRKTGIKL